MKNIFLLGATGSIGTQTLDVIRNHKDKFILQSLSIGRNIQKGIEIITEFQPKFVSVMNEDDYRTLKNLFPAIEFGVGNKGLIEAATYEANNSFPNIVVTAVVGSVGLSPTVAAIKKGYDIALANKETLVTAGDIVMELVKKNHVRLLPVDSEHAAIFQCLNGEDPKKVNQLIITASGGSFRNKTREELKTVTLKDALNHPTWTMGSKITIDSATMMNKGFEVIEAHHLFDLPPSKINTILHQESVIHSMVEFVDYSIMAQLGTADMRIPIQYALTYPERIESFQKQLDLGMLSTLHFKPMDFIRFPILGYAYEALKIGHSLPCVLNAANDAAVSLFLNEQIHFLDIERIIEKTINQQQLIKNPDLETILSLEQEIKHRIVTSKGDLTT